MHKFSMVPVVCDGAPLLALGVGTATASADTTTTTTTAAHTAKGPSKLNPEDIKSIESARKIYRALGDSRSVARGLTARGVS